MAQKNLRSALSRLRIGLRQGAKQDILEDSDRSTTLTLANHKIKCDYLELLEMLEQPTSETNQLIKNSLNLEFLKGLEFSNRLDIRGDLEHPLFNWFQTKRDRLKHKVDEVFSGQRLLATVQTQSIQTLLSQEPSSAELNNLYVFCQSSDYPFDERQCRKDTLSILTYFSRLYTFEDENKKNSGVSTSVLLLAFVALAEGQLKAIYLEDALAKYNEVQKNAEQTLIDLWGMLEELQDDDWLVENETLTLKHEAVVKGWLSQNPRVAATLLKALLEVTPADEGELLAELYTAPVELLEHLGKEDSNLLLLAARENLVRELPERAATLLNYGIKDIFADSQKDYAYLLLAYAYERAGHYEPALSNLERLSSSTIYMPIKRQDSLPSSPKDLAILKQYILLKTGALGQKDIVELEAQAEPTDLSWSEAKRFNLLGTYYLYNAIDTQEEDQRFQKAIHYFEIAKAIWENLGGKNNVIGELTNVAVAYTISEDFDNAEKMFEYTLKHVQKLKANALAHLRVLFCYASEQLRKDDYEKALALFGECYKVPGVEAHRNFLMRVSFNQGLIYHMYIYNELEAERYYEITRDIATSIGDQAARGRAIASLGLLKKQKFLVDSGINIIRQSGNTSDLEDYILERDKIWPS